MQNRRVVGRVHYDTKSLDWLGELGSLVEYF